MTTSTLEDIFLNKRVIVKYPLRDNNGKIVPGKFTTAGGICQQIGPNPHLGIDLQVVIDRTPVQVSHINDIQLVESK